MASEGRNQRAKLKRSDADKLERAGAGNLRHLLLRASRAINQDVTVALRAAGFKDLKNSQVFCLAHKHPCWRACSARLFIDVTRTDGRTRDPRPLHNARSPANGTKF